MNKYLAFLAGETQWRRWAEALIFTGFILLVLVFTPIGGVLALIPMVGLGVGYVFKPELRTRTVEALLYVLVETSRGEARWAWGIYASLWCVVLVWGLGLHLFYRTLPFMARENGEWAQPVRQDMLREVNRGSDHPLIVPGNRPGTYEQDLVGEYAVGWTRAQATGQEAFPAMTLPMMTGFPILPGSKGDFIAGGYPPAYVPRPTEHYVGSYDLDQIARDGNNDKSFVSGSFRPTADYVTLDMLVDKRARFSF